jgi:DHA2 family multidrug resistance protein
MLIYELHPPEELNRAVSLYSMGILVGPVIGPPLGGFLVEIANWRWIFLVNVPFGILSVATLIIFLPKLARIPVRPFDFLGFGLLAIGLLCLQLMLDRGQGKGWFTSAEIVVELSLCVTAFYMFMAHTFTTKHPFLDFTILKDRNFCLATMMTFIISLISFIPTVIFPLFLQHVRGYDVFDTGLILMPRGMAMVGSMLLMSRLPGNLDHRWLVAFGLVMNSVGFFFLGGLTPDYPSSLIIAVSVGTAIGQSIAMLPVQMLAFATMPLELRPMGTSLYNLIRATSVSVGTALALSYVARSTEDNHVRLLQKLSVYNPLMTGSNMPENVASPLFLKLLSIEIWRQATVIAYNNMFTIGFVLSVIIVPFAFLVREARQATPAPVVAEEREALDVAAGVHA